MSERQPRGILRNKSVSDENSTSPHGSSSSHHVCNELDRQEVVKNTRLNAQLQADLSSKGDAIRAKIAQMKREQGIDEAEPASTSHEHLRWDEINIYKNEQEKSATMKIDEPKTPYEGGFNPEGEYYKDDDDEDEERGGGEEDDGIPEFELGEGEYDKLPQGSSSSLYGGQVIKDYDGDEPQEAEPQEEQLSAEERHKRFEEKRKEHYHLKALPLKHKIDIPDDDIDVDNDDNADADDVAEK
ncbi:uncharacterized protein LODBEIA_P48800 [Lodderomyces beijingensis]|uniref:Protein GLC8 n=1 Tax=Lodderomyces beijingensis TaxID=1775926 RepID=A0ABP0ZU50_9ASCO